MGCSSVTAGTLQRGGIVRETDAKARNRLRINKNQAFSDANPKLSHPICIVMNVKNQLQLIEAPTNWRLDDHTKEVGREGLRLARTKLRAARVMVADDPSTLDVTETAETIKTKKTKKTNKTAETSIPKAA